VPEIILASASQATRPAELAGQLAEAKAEAVAAGLKTAW
jgi:predicted house-cleaning NTP pyrophosphatase (Maf/HAM1 superfamily)